MKASVSEALRVTLITCGTTAVAEGVFAAIDAVSLGPWPHTVLDLGHAALALLVGGTLWGLRKRLLVAHCDLGFALVICGYLPIFWAGELDGAAQGHLRSPVIPHHLVMLGVAMMTPGSVWLGSALIGGTAVSAVTLVTLLSRSNPLLRVSGEPWISLVFAGVALALLISRHYRRAAIWKLERSRAEVEALARLARVFLAMRDRVNTPLQTLEFGSTLLDHRYPEAAAVLGPMRRATSHLRELFLLLARVDDWRSHAPGQPLEPLDLTHELEGLANRGVEGRS
jgi:hypothetical protein